MYNHAHKLFYMLLFKVHRFEFKSYANYNLSVYFKPMDITVSYVVITNQ